MELMDSRYTSVVASGAASFIGYLLEEFTPEERLVSTCMAAVRLFDRLGNRENMARNRMRYLVNEMGWEKFQKLVIKERSNVEMTISLETLNRYKVESEGPNIRQLSNGKKLPLINEKVDINSDRIKDGFTPMWFPKNRMVTLWCSLRWVPAI